MLVFLTIILSIISLLLISIIIVFIFFAIDLFLDLPYVATKKDKIPTIIKLAQIKRGHRLRRHSGLEGETAIDLGSGDGRLLFAAAQIGAHTIGYEINPFLVVLTRSLAKLKGLASQVVIHKQNLWKADLKIADVIFVYGRKKDMQKFEDFVYKNAKKGTRIVVNTNQFPNKKPHKSEN